MKPHNWNPLVQRTYFVKTQFRTPLSLRFLCSPLSPPKFPYPPLDLIMNGSKIWVILSFSTFVWTSVPINPTSTLVEVSGDKMSRTDFQTRTEQTLMSIYEWADINEQILMSRYWWADTDEQILMSRYWWADIDEQILMSRYWYADVDEQILMSRYWWADIEVQMLKCRQGQSRLGEDSVCFTISTLSNLFQKRPPLQLAILQLCFFCWRCCLLCCNPPIDPVAWSGCWVLILNVLLNWQL